MSRNSVGTKQLINGAVMAPKLHRNAVKSSIVSDNSLLAEDFKAGELSGALPGAPDAEGRSPPTGKRRSTAIRQSEGRRRRDLGYSSEMPRYHAIIRGTDLRPVKKAVSVNVKGRKRSERTVDLRAENKAAARRLVTARLPKKGDTKVVEVREVKD